MGYFNEAHKYTAPGIVAGITPTDGGHIFFDSNHNSGAGEDSPTAHYMQIRGITYGVSAHLHKWADGSWNIGKEEDSIGTRMYHQLYMTRVHSRSNNDASDAARRKAMETITAIVRQWVSENPEALAQAERKAIEEKLAKVQARITEILADLQAATAESQALQAQLSPTRIN